MASGDVDGDGFAELVTTPGAAPAIPAATFGNAPRIITIYSGNLAAVWQSVSLNVTAAFPGYSGGFQVTFGDEVVVATAAPAGTVVQTFSVAGGSFAAQSTFQARSYVEGDPQRRLRDVFANGASLAVVNATGRSAAGQVFAALRPQNTTGNMIRLLAWSSLAASWSGVDAFQVQPSGRNRFPLGGGLLLG